MVATVILAILIITYIAIVVITIAVVATVVMIDSKVKTCCATISVATTSAVPIVIVTATKSCSS
jgi:hypothetical protein